MTRMNQLLALTRFTASINPFGLVMLLAIGSPVWIRHLQPTSYHRDLASILMVPNLLMVGIVGLWTVAPEMAQTAWTRGAATISGSEFLLTRAVDRALLYRARALCLYGLILVVPLISLAWSLFHPSLLLAVYSKVLQPEYLQALPGSSLHLEARTNLPLIFVPYGNVWIGLWELWLFIASALLMQVLILSLHRLPFRLFIFYILFMSAVFLPVFFDGTRHDLLSRVEQAFFWEVAHPLLFWFGTAVLFIAVQAWCERWFSRQEM